LHIHSRHRSGCSTKCGVLAGMTVCRPCDKQRLLAWQEPCQTHVSVQLLLVMMKEHI
jgi:hypothetical protein